MKIARARKDKKRADQLGQDTDYGFHYPLKTVESAYFDWARCDYRLMFEGGGWWEEDPLLWQDVYTYAWLFTLAEQVLDSEDK